MSETKWHGTTILSVRKNGKVIVIGDGQVSAGQTVMKPNARKVRQLGDGSVIGGFAGATADAFTLFERLEAKLERHPGQLLRAAIELAKDWRTDRYLRRLEAMMAVADKNVSLIMSGNGDVLEPEDGIIGIGSGGGYALAGHIHPAVRLSASGEKSVRLPCFWFGARCGVLPAFGAFTGSAEVLPRRGDQVFVIAEEEVLQVA